MFGKPNLPQIARLPPHKYIEKQSFKQNRWRLLHWHGESADRRNTLDFRRYCMTSQFPCHKRWIFDFFLFYQYLIRFHPP